MSKNRYNCGGNYNNNDNNCKVDNRNNNNANNQNNNLGFRVVRSASCSSAINMKCQFCRKGKGTHKAVECVSNQAMKCEYFLKLDVRCNSF